MLILGGGVNVLLYVQTLSPESKKQTQAVSKTKKKREEKTLATARLCKYFLYETFVHLLGVNCNV